MGASVNWCNELWLRHGLDGFGVQLMGEWEDGLAVARDRGIIDEELQGRLMSLEFVREHKQQGFPMRIALMVLGSIVLLIPLFAITVRVLGPDPSEFLIAFVLLVLGAITEGIALLVRRAKSLAFLAGIIGSFAGVPLGFAILVALPNDAKHAKQYSCVLRVESRSIANKTDKHRQLTDHRSNSESTLCTPKPQKRP